MSQNLRKVVAMSSVGTTMKSIFLTVATLSVLLCTTAAQPRDAEGLTGRITDQMGAVIINAAIIAVDGAGVERTSTTNSEGVYVFRKLPPGLYTVRVSAPGFALYQNAEVEIAVGRRETLNVMLGVRLEIGEVKVNPESPVSTSPESRAGAVILRDSDLDTLPDDPDDLTNVLQALAGPTVGPNGGQVIVDGFTGNNVPPKSSIREVRLNQNPFSAEFDQLGFGRIEIFTKPGTDKVRGQAFFNFNDESLNSRNPFAQRRASFQSRFYGGNLSGPITRQSSYFIDLQRRETDDNAVINATVVDSVFDVRPFSQVVLTPKRLLTFSSRFDDQLNPNNTLMARYSFSRSTSNNSGVGNFSLLSRAFDTSQTSHTLQLTETAILNPSTVSQTLFQYIRRSSSLIGDRSLPGIRVLEAFTGGGSQVGQSASSEDRWEVTNITTWAPEAHTVRFGGRLRGVKLTDVSEANFGGTYTFAGGFGPQLDANDQIVLDPVTGGPLIVPITSIERYRRTLLFRGRQLTPEQIRGFGGGATQFSIAGGNAEAGVSQTDLGVFVLDDWRLRPNFTLSLGLRYETQNNISSRFGLAPRVAFAWSPAAGASGQSRTVVRGGFGVFYERFGETLTLQANRFNTSTQQFFIVQDPALLDFFPAVPPLATLASFATSPISRRIASDLREPYTLQTALSLERQLPYDIAFSTTFINARSLHLLRSRNINAPIPGTFIPGDPSSGQRPFGNAGGIFLYESSGVQNLRQLIFNVSGRLNKDITLFGTYILSTTKNDTDGPNSFPADSYDLSNEYGRSAFDFRHRFFAGGSIGIPWDIRLNPLVIMSSSRPFNITTGRDTNGDTAFTERPAFADGSQGVDVVATPFGAFDLNPQPGQRLVPRNYGNGPSFFWVIMRASRTFGFADIGGAKAAPGQGGAAAGGRPADKRYKLTLSVQIQNLFNRTNAAAPIGNLSSPLFGLSNSIGGGTFSDSGGVTSSSNRRIELQMRLIF